MMFRSLSQFKQIGDRAKERKQPCLFPATSCLAVGSSKPEQSHRKMADLSKITFSISISLWPEKWSGLTPGPRRSRCRTIGGAGGGGGRRGRGAGGGVGVVRPIMDFRDSDRNRSRIAESNFYFGAKKVDRSSRFDQLLLTRSTLCEMFVKGGRMWPLGLHPSDLIQEPS